MALTTAQYQALKSEATADPKAYGFAALWTAGNDTGLAAALNWPRDGATVFPGNNVAGPAISINRGSISAQELVEAVVQSEMPSNASQRDWLIMVCQGDRVRVDTGSTARAGLLGIFGAATVTRANLTAAASRAGSRVEELFGLNVGVTTGDIAQARQS